MVAKHTRRGAKTYRPRVKRSPPTKTRAEKILSAIPCGMVIGAMVCGVAHLVECCFTFSPAEDDTSEPPPRKTGSSKRVRFEGIDEEDTSPSGLASSLVNSSIMLPETNDFPIARATANKRHEHISEVHNETKSTSRTSLVSAPTSSTAPPRGAIMPELSNNVVKKTIQVTRTTRQVRALNDHRGAAEDDSNMVHFRHRSCNPDHPDIIVTAPRSPASAETIELAQHMKQRESVRDENGELRGGLAIQRKLRDSYTVNENVPGLARGCADLVKDESKKAIAQRSPRFSPMMRTA